MNASCNLADASCVPCRGGVPPLKGQPLAELRQQLGDDWALVNDHHLERTFTFRNFRDALAYTNRVGAIAEAEGHHPEITTTWGAVTIRIWTHKVDGLTESDFVLAAKCDRAYA